MIQDIEPHKWDITYKKDKKCEDETILLFFYQGKILVQEEKDGGIVFPRKRDITAEESLRDDSKLAQSLSVGNYLFALDDVGFYRISIETEELSDKLIQCLPNAIWANRHYFRRTKPKELAFAALTGMHVNGWYDKNRFCGVCGKKLIHDDKERMMHCPNCNNMIYPRINPAVIVAVTDKDRILLTKYAGREYKNYALIAGFNEIGESLEDTVRREVYEEAGLKVKNIRYYKSQPWGMSDNILAGFFCELDGEDTINMDHEELSIAEWVSRGSHPVEREDLSLTNEMICRFLYDEQN